MTFGLLDRGTETTPGVTAPRIALAFGGGGGGLGGLAAGLLGGSAGALEDGLIEMRLTRGFAPFVDWAEVLLAPVPGGAELPSLGDSGTVTVSSGDQSSVFTASVDSLEQRGDGTARLGLGNGGRVLAQARVETAYTEQT
ncbi:MAG: hypothetical protein AAFX00_11345, partial [Pseudomonadota bacterium]